MAKIKGKQTSLLKKTSKNYLVSGLLLVCLSMVVLYFTTQYFIREETDEALNSTLYRIDRLLLEGQKIESLNPIIVVKQGNTAHPPILKDTLLLDPIENEMEVFRELSVGKEVNGAIYDISLRNRVVDSEDILLAILGSYFGILMILFFAQSYFNKLNTKSVWKPFFENLGRIQNFSLQSQQKLDLLETDIKEFSQLNKELQKLTDKAIVDYKNLRQFTEDVSHEMQTPLAVMQATTGSIMDANQMDEKQFALLSRLQQNIQRLSLLNKKLGLLAKIENQQFTTIEKVNLTECLEQSVANFKEMGEQPVKFGTLDPVYATIDKTLAQTLIDNLVLNAFRHVKKGGQVKVFAENKTITIANTGENPIQHPERLYDRFYREHPSKKSLGLGLAIAKKICDAFGLSINYFFEDGYHHFSIYVPSKDI